MNKKPPTTSIRHLARNSIYNTATTISSSIIAIIVVPCIISHLGIVRYGLYSLLTGLVGYYALLDLGLGEGVVKFVAEYRAKGNEEGIRSSINAALIVQFFFGILGSAILCVSAGPVMGILKVPAVFNGEFTRCLYMTSFGFLFTMIGGTYASAIKGLQRYDKIGKLTIPINIGLNLAIVIALFGFNAGLQPLVGITVVFAVVSFVIVRIAVARELPGYRFSFLLDSHYLKKIFQYSGFLFLSRLSSVFNTSIAQFIISMFLGPAAVAYFQVPYKLINAAGTFLSGAFMVVFPYASELSAGDDPGKVGKLFLQGTRLFASIAVPGYLLLAVFSRPLLHLWMGSEFAEHGWMVMSILAFSSLLGSLTTVPNFITMGLGRSRLIFAFSLVTVLFYSVFLPVFTKLFGLTGAAAAIMVSQLPGIILICYESWKVMRIRIFAFISHTLGFHAIPALISVALFFVIPHYRCLLDIRISAPSLALYCALYGGAMIVTRWISPEEYIARIWR